MIGNAKKTKPISKNHKKEKNLKNKNNHSQEDISVSP